jgi:hypothetical protein
MKKPTLTEHDTQIASKTIGFFLETDTKAQFDSAAQCVLLPLLLPYHNKAKDKLSTEFGVPNPDEAMKALLQFHQDFLGKMEFASQPQQQVRFSKTKVHHFYSLMYNLIDQPDAPFEEYRAALEKSFGLLKLPKPLTTEELKPHIAEIIATTSPAFDQKIQR